MKLNVPSVIAMKRPETPSASQSTGKQLKESIDALAESALQKKIMPHHQPRQTQIVSKCKAESPLTTTPHTSQGKSESKLDELSSQKEPNPKINKGSFFYTNLIKANKEKNVASGSSEEAIKAGMSRPAINFKQNIITVGSNTQEKIPGKMFKHSNSQEYIPPYENLNKNLYLNSPRVISNSPPSMSYTKPDLAQMLILKSSSPKSNLASPSVLFHQSVDRKTNEKPSSKFDIPLNSERRPGSGKQRENTLLKSGGEKRQGINIEKSKLAQMLSQINDGKSHLLTSGIYGKSSKGMQF